MVRWQQPGDWHLIMSKKDDAVSPVVRSAITMLRRWQAALRTLEAPAPTDRIAVSSQGAGLQPIKQLLNPQDTEQVEAAVRHLYRLALRRRAHPNEVATWANAVANKELTVASMVTAIATSPEAAQAAAQTLLPNLSHGTFIQLAYEILLDRGAAPDEIAQWVQRLERGDATRLQVLSEFFQLATNQSLAGPQAQNDPTRALIPGVGKIVSRDEWACLLEATRRPDRCKPKEPASPRFNIASKPRILVTAIASMYKGNTYIARFMENITNQTIFRDYGELIIIDANSPEQEFQVIEPYLSIFSNIRYRRTAAVVGIYEAWNLAIAEARGEYITNTNLDDLRRRDSLELQAATLDKLTFADVVYQDVYYTFDSKLTFDEIAAVGLNSKIPVVSRYNLLRFNAPHNGPMWRRRLHDELGLFDPTYKSAGDYEFWLRCAVAGKTFYKLNDPHVVYFVNPDGISTRPNTRGGEEAARISKKYARQLISRALVDEPAAFLRQLSERSEKNSENGEISQSTADWRYVAVQRALRQASAKSRAPAKAALA